MRKFVRLHRGLSLVLALVMVLVLGVGIYASVGYFKLDKTILSTVTITQAPETYGVEVLASPVSGGVVTGGVSNAENGNTTTIEATANEGYVFTGWSGDYEGTENPHTVTIHSNMTITANFAELTNVTLYTDALCTNPIPSDYVHNFGSVEEGETPANPLWFKASEIPPSSINVTAIGLPSGASIQFMVGTPINAMTDKPCTLALWLSDMPSGTYDFSIRVTGQSY